MMFVRKLSDMRPNIIMLFTQNYLLYIKKTLVKSYCGACKRVITSIVRIFPCYLQKLSGYVFQQLFFRGQKNYRGFSTLVIYSVMRILK